MFLNCGAREDAEISPLDSKIKVVNLKGHQHWIFIGSTDAEVEILWPPDVKSQLTGKDPDAGKDWGQEEKGVTNDQMVGWHHRLNGYKFEQTPGDGEGQGSLAWCSSWDHREVDTTEQLNKRLLYLSLHRKVLNSLTWDTWFFFNSNPLMFQLLFCLFVLQNSFIPWLLPHHFGTIPQSWQPAS